MSIPLQTLEDAAKAANHASFQAMIDWFALQSEHVKSNATIVDPAALGQDYFLHIDKKPPPFFYPMMPRSAGDQEDNTCPRITVSPDLVACVVGYNRLFEDYGKGIDKDLEGHADYEGGYVISKLPFEYALKINDKLVPECAQSREHWLVAYNEAAREVHPVEVGKMFMTQMYQFPNGETSVHLLLEVSDPQGFFIAPNLPCRQGYYDLQLLWKNKDDPCSLLEEHISLTAIEHEHYTSKKGLIAAFLSHENPPQDQASLYHANVFSAEQFNNAKNCDWMAVRGADLKKHAWASSSKFGAYVAAFESAIEKSFPGSRIEVNDAHMKVTLADRPKDLSARPATFNPVVSMYLVAPTHGQHWWQHGNMKRMYEPEAGTLLKLRDFPGKEGVKHGEVLSLELFLHRHHLDLEYVVENAPPAPSVLYHASGYEHRALRSGYKRSGELQKWDMTESNKFLYASSDRGSALEQGICGAMERLGATDPTRPTYVSRFQVDGNRITVTYTGHALDRKKLMEQSLYLYTLQVRPDERWTPVISGRNPDYPEYKTRVDIPTVVIQKVEEVKLHVVLGAYSLKFILGSSASQDW